MTAARRETPGCALVTGASRGIGAATAQRLALGSSNGSAKLAAEKTNHVQGIEHDLRQKLGLKVEIKVRAKDKGQIVLAFESNDDFERLLEVLRR